MNDDADWTFFNDDGRVAKVVGEALAMVGRVDVTFLARYAIRSGAGAGDPRCAELWCALVPGFATEVRHCMSTEDGEKEMIAKFARTLKVS